MSDWRRFFDEYAPKYDREIFVQHTEAEIPVIIEKLHPSRGGQLLDIGCGTGRHSVGLARLGYCVTGVDLSAEMLGLAQRRAEEASVHVEWVHTNAAEFVRPDAFDGAICMCEGAICLLGADDDPLQRDLTILRNVYGALRPGGRFLLNVLNGCRQIRAYSDKDVDSGRFDVLNMTEISDVKELLPHDPALHQLRERGYTPPEIRRMLAWVGFDVLGVYGGTAGAWNFQPPKLDEIELMVLAEKPERQVSPPPFARIEPTTTSLCLG